MHYRRHHQPGACYFFTLVTYQRQPLLTQTNIDHLRRAFKREMQKRAFSIDAIVILPDHLHTLWQLPEQDSNYSVRWSNIKRFFSTSCEHIQQTASKSRDNKREKAVWQRRFWEHTIRDELDWQKHMDYIHYNPVKHGYVESPSDWPFSSFQQCVAKGWYPEDWGAIEPNAIKDMHYE
jgi:putative transposase